jgi:hypothetical protein
MAYVTVRIKGEEGYSRVALDKDRMVVGRTSACDVPILHESISREHCVLVRLHLEDGRDQWSVEDAGSANGTRVGRRNEEDAPVAGAKVLAEGDIIKIGRGRLTFHAQLRSSRLQAIPAGGSEIPRLLRQAEDPPAAVACDACQHWLSIAHRQPGDQMSCPHCGHKLTVPLVEETLAP